jgi:hypothetical protein
MVATLLSLIIGVQAQIVSIQELLNQSKTFDQQTVIIEAEVILEVLERGDMAWLNVNDGTNAIGVYLPLSMTEQLSSFGDHQNKGDFVRIEAVFYRNCNEHGGEMDLHATRLSIIEAGYKIERPISTWKFSFALVGFTLSMVSLWLYHMYRVGIKKSNDLS